MPIGVSKRKPPVVRGTAVLSEEVEVPVVERKVPAPEFLEDIYLLDTPEISKGFANFLRSQARQDSLITPLLVEVSKSPIENLIDRTLAKGAKIFEERLVKEESARGYEVRTV